MGWYDEIFPVGSETWLERQRTERNNEKVRWYEQCGKYPTERIVRANAYSAWLVNDDSWNETHPDKPEILEGSHQFFTLPDKLIPSCMLCQHLEDNPIHE